VVDHNGHCSTPGFLIHDALLYPCASFIPATGAVDDLDDREHDGNLNQNADHPIKVTFIDGDENRPAARVHLLWEPWEWLSTQETVNWTMDQFKRGMFLDGRKH
jgi:hypothetical protein